MKSFVSLSLGQHEEPCWISDRITCRLHRSFQAEPLITTLQAPEAWVRSDQGESSQSGKSSHEPLIGLLQRGDCRIARHAFKILKKYFQTLPLDQILPKILDGNAGPSEAWSSSQALRVDRYNTGTSIRRRK